YTTPVIVFISATILAVIMSPEPTIGAGVMVRKALLFTMGLLAANAVTTPLRARLAHSVLLAVACATSILAIGQFVRKYIHFLSTGSDDPTVLARITGTMGHWMTFSGELLLVWCAVIPMVIALSRKWMIPLGIVGAAIVLSFTRSAWLGSVA